MSTIPVNPLSLAYGVLRQAVEGHPDCDRLVKLGNRVFFDTGDRDPQKKTIAAADLPELQLFPNGGSITTESSDSLRIVQKFLWWITTGDRRADALLWPVEWMLIAAMVEAGYSQINPGGPRWGTADLPFIENIAITDLADAMAAHNKDQEREIVGWSAVLAVQVEMSLSVADVRPVNRV